MAGGVISGAEPFSIRAGPGGVLVLHGFTGSPQSMRGVAEVLAGAGYSVELPLLPGHGTDVQDMLPTRFSDYSSAAETALDELSARSDGVCVVGLSMGGTLGCWLAERHPELRGLVLINPFVEPPADSYREVLRSVLESGSEVGPGVGSDIAKGGVHELAYDQSPLVAALSLFDGIDQVAGRLGEINCPMLLMSSREDHVVPSSSGDFLLERVSGPVERVWLERSYHVATLDYDAPEIEASTLAFARRVLGPDDSQRAAADASSGNSATRPAPRSRPGVR